MTSKKTRVYNCYHNVDSVEEGYKWIDEKLENNDDVIWYRAQLELTQKGGIHVQAVWGYEHARYIRPVIKMMEETAIQATDDAKSQIKYCTDEDKRIVDTEIRLKGNFVEKTNKDKWAEDFRFACTLPTHKESMAWMLEHHPKHYCSQMKQLSQLFNSLKPKKDRIKYTMDQFTAPPIPEKDLKERTIVLVGRSSLGKTSYAKAHFKNPVVVKNKTDYSKITDDNDGIVFDDIEMYNWAPMTVRTVVDLEEGGTHDVKYGSIYIPEGMPRFVIINREENFWPKCLFNDDGDINGDCLIDYESIEKRIIIKEITEPLFNKPIENLQQEFDRANATIGKTRKNPHTYKKKFNSNDYIRFAPY